MNESFIPFTQHQREALIIASMNSPSKNIHGLLGPRCPVCSGLGSVLRMGGENVGLPITRSTSRCTCAGSGIDLALLERQSNDMLWQRIQELERILQLPKSQKFKKKSPDIKASRQFWMECIAWATADATAVASSTTETVLFPAITLPANYLADSRGLRLKAMGKYSTLGSGTVSHVFRLRYGAAVSGVLLAASGTITLAISLTNCLFEIELTIQTRSNGSSGTLMCNGSVHVFGGTAPSLGSATGAPAEAPMTAGGQTAPATATCDLTVDTPLSLTIQHGANSASNTATGLQLTLESLN